MSIIVPKGTPIPVHTEGKRLPALLPNPQIQIPRQPQQHDAWCYAACASMLIDKLRPAAPARQCQVASFVKNVPTGNADCCHPGAPPKCTNSGCKKTQIKGILTHFGVNSQESGSFMTLSAVSQEVNATPGRPIEIVIDWRGVPGQSSSHAVLLIGVSGSWVFVRDPLRGHPYDGWRTHADVLRGFGQGRWSMSWSKLM